MPDTNPTDRDRSPTTDGGISDDELIEELQRLADELEKTPTRREMAEHGAYGTTTYESRFGSWNSALEQAGLEPRLWGEDLEFEWASYEEWLDDLVERSVDTLRRLFGQYAGAESFQDAEVVEDTLANVEQFIDQEGTEFLDSPKWSEEGVPPQERALALIVSGALLSACRNRDLPIRVDEVTNVIRHYTGLEIETKTVSQFKRRVDGAAGEWVPPTSAERFLERYAAELGVHPDTLDAALTIVDDLPENTDPNVAAASALWLGSRQTGEPMRRITLLQTANVSGPAVRDATPDEYDYEKPTVRFGRAVRESITIPEVVVEWLDIDGDYIVWPALEEMDGSTEESNRIRTIPQAVIQLSVVDDAPESDRPVSKITEHESKDGVWSVDVPAEYREHLPDTVVLSWQWDWSQNTGQLILREYTEEGE